MTSATWVTALLMSQALALLSHFWTVVLRWCSAVSEPPVPAGADQVLSGPPCLDHHAPGCIRPFPGPDPSSRRPRRDVAALWLSAWLEDG